MDWLRRNWPDLLIGLALVAVIAGIIATLISGGSFFPAGNRTAENPDPGTTPLAGPATPGAQPDQASAAANGANADLEAAGADAADAGQPGSASSLTATPAASASTDDSSAAEAGAAGADDAASAGNAAGDRASNAAEGGALPVAVLPPGQTAADESQAAGSTEGAAPAPSQAGAGNASSVTSSAAASADSGIDLEASASPEAPYRVSVGAYGNRDNAERQAATFEAAGYPVFIGTQGALNIVLVGPYDTESEARTVAARIRNADLGVADPTIYEFTGETDDQATTAAVGNQSTPSPAAAPAAAESLLASDETVITSSPSSVSGVRYLQAGAYGTRDSSLPQRERLEGLGFVVTERVENDLVKLLIGPFDAANLQNAQGRLEAAGIASFPR